jgi:Helix-turn-helix domain
VPSPVGIGQSLREARLARGTTLEAVEAKTRIRTRYLRALENERFDELPGEAYAKGFLRTYADHLGLDGQEFLAAYRAHARAVAEPAVVPRAQRAYDPPRTGPALAGAVAAVLLTALSLAAWRLGDDEPPARPAPPTVVVQGGALAVMSTGPSRLEVRLGGEQGRMLWAGTLRGGQQLRFGLGRPLWLRARVARRIRLAAGESTRGFPAGRSTIVVRAG